MPSERNRDTVPSTQFEYGKGKWWNSTITTFGAAQLMKLGGGIERNHLIPKAFLEKGPPETKDLGKYVPVLPLSHQEHTGATYSFHYMKDGQQVGTGKSAFRGCGLNDFLLAQRINIRAESYSSKEVSAAINACETYHRMIGLDHAAKAIRQFKTEIYENPAYRKKK
jgi:hypothetical protein